MILIDTNILIDLMRKPTKAQVSAIAHERIAYCGVVQAEFLQGAKSDGEVIWLQEVLKDMDYIDLLFSDWQRIGFFLRTLRSRGLTVPFADAIISYLAIKHACPVWTGDRHFALIASALPDLHLFTLDE